jgi:hypothetical protein
MFKILGLDALANKCKEISDSLYRLPGGVKLNDATWNKIKDRILAIDAKTRSVARNTIQKIIKNYNLI